MKIAYAALLICLSQFLSAQWNPYAGVVNSLTQGANVITSSGGSAPLAIDGDKSTCWQSGNPNAALPQGYLSRSDLNMLLGVGSTIRFKRSGTGNGANTTDGNLGTSATISLTGSKAWVSYDFPVPVTLRTVSVKCSVPSDIQIFAYESSADSFLIGTLRSGDNFSLRKFTPLLN